MNELSEQLKKARKVIAKNRVMVLTGSEVVNERLYVNIRKQLRNEILKEFDETFKDYM